MGATLMPDWIVMEDPVGVPTSDVERAYEHGFNEGMEYQRKLDKASEMRLYGTPDLPRRPSNPYRKRRTDAG